jgi:hypothetical protein
MTRNSPTFTTLALGQTLHDATTLSKALAFVWR